MNRILSYILALSLILSFAVPVLAAEGKTVYVAVDGSDQNGGEIASPFATIQKALDVVKGARSAEIILRGGEYRIDETIVLTAANSNLTIKAYEGETPVLNAGRYIEGWIKEGNLYKAKVLQGFTFRNLYVEGQKAQRGRYPNYGENLLIPGTPTDEYIPIAKGIVEKIPGYENNVEMRINVEWMHKVLRINQIRDGGEVANAYINPIEWDSLKGPQGAKIAVGRQYWLENALEFVDSSGEWYLDKKESVVYYYPHPYEDMKNVRVLAGDMENIFRLNGTSSNPIENITIEGLTFIGTGWTRPDVGGLVDVQANSLVPMNRAANEDAQYRHNLKKDKLPGAIQASFVNNASVNKCIFENLGASAVVFEMGGENIIVKGNRIYDVYGSGIEIGSDYYRTKDKRMYHKNVSISNNYLEFIANEYYGGVGIQVFYADGLRVEHNELSNLPYTGISVGWGWGESEQVEESRNFTIRYNKVKDFMRILRDGGGIYTPNPTGGTNMIEKNYVIGNEIVFMPTSGTVAIYHDGASSNWTTKSNVLETFGRYIISTQSIRGQECSNILVTQNYSSPNRIKEITDASLDGRNVVAKDNYHYTRPVWPEDAKLIIDNAGLEKGYEPIRKMHPLTITLNEFYKEMDIDDKDVFRILIENNGQAKDVVLNVAAPEGLSAEYQEEVSLLQGETKAVPVIISSMKDTLENYYVLPVTVTWGNGRKTIARVGVRVSNSKALYVDITDISYQENGDFAGSSLSGYTGVSRYGYSKGAWARWTPEIMEEGDYKVSIFVLNHATSDTKAKIDVVYDGGTHTDTINFVTHSGGWHELGTFRFKKGTTGYVQNSKGSSEKDSGFIRTSAVAFVKVSETDESKKAEARISKLGNSVVMRTDKAYYYNNSSKVISTGSPRIKGEEILLPAKTVADLIGGKAFVTGEEMRIVKGAVGARLISGNSHFELNRVRHELSLVLSFADVQSYIPARAVLERWGFGIFIEENLIVISKEMLLDKEKDEFLIETANNAFIQ